MKKPFVLIAAIVAVVGLGAAVAVAKEATKDSASVSIKLIGGGDVPPEGGTFTGWVNAKRRGCQGDRNVVLIDHTPGRAASDRTNDRGRYRIVKNRVKGSTSYFVTVRKKIIENGGEEIVCNGVRSEILATCKRGCKSAGSEKVAGVASTRGRQGRHG